MHQDSRRQQWIRLKDKGFTLIELLVVIAIIALLIGILLPSLGSARLSAQSIIVASNARGVTQAATLYNSGNKAIFPPSYVYGEDREGFGWRTEMQRGSHPSPINGYIHWSYALYDNGEVPDDAFESPAVPSRGAPRTNPGPDTDAWEAEQVNDMGQREGAGWPQDRQVKRLAFAANAAIMPRNKFYLGSSQRKAVLVKAHKIVRPANEILFTEFRETANWRSLADPVGIGGSGGSENVIKSHRPITPFRGRSAGAEVFDEPAQHDLTRFEYPDVEELTEVLNSIQGDQIGLIIGQGGSGSSLEAVNNVFKGKANFAYVDGHVALDEVINTVINRQWGDRFYSISGNNEILDADD
jgi:prepilin-type N-terminal cleavage/methylation domain-containing protein/prepilin-type processing-associated H-X9-DG protein